MLYQMIMNLIFLPAAFGYDEIRLYEAAVTGWGVPILYWFNSITMMLIRNVSIDTSYALTWYNNQTSPAVGNTHVV